MSAIGWDYPFWLVVFIWVARTVWLSVICSILGWLGTRVLDIMHPRGCERRYIGESPISTGLFIAGFFIFMGLVIHGVINSPCYFGSSIWHCFFDTRQLGMLVISFAMSLIIGLLMFYLVDKLTPRIPFSNVGGHPIGAGLYVFSYLIFFGLILHASLTTPI